MADESEGRLFWALKTAEKNIKELISVCPSGLLLAVTGAWLVIVIIHEVVKIQYR